MYGMVNKAMEELVVMNHGPETWEEIKRRANVDIDVFIANEGYPDAMTYALATKTSEVLGQPMETILHAFGEHWILHTAREGYGNLLHAGGKTIGEFLCNLPNFHSRVTLIFPNLQPPRFVCSDVTTHSLRLHYHTHRPGLSPFVRGLLSGLAVMYDCTLEVVQSERKEAGADHDIFDISWKSKKQE